MSRRPDISPTAALLWAELAVAKREREARAESERQAAEADAAVASGEVDFSDPDLQEALRSQVRRDRAAEQASFERRVTEHYRSQYGEDAARSMARDAIAQSTAPESAWFYRGDPLLDSPVWAEAQRRSAALDSEQDVVDRLAGPTMFEAAEQAQRDVDAFLASRRAS